MLSLPDSSIRPQTALAQHRWTANACWLGLWGALYAVVFLALYPRLYASVDEATTYGMIPVLKHLTIYPARAGVILPQLMSPLGPHGHIYWFPIGYPVILAAASLLGAWAIFLINPVLHLVATWRFARLLRASGIPEGCALLYLFYPGFVLYDRTLFSDGFAASLITVALSLLIGRKDRAGWAGACLGIAFTARSLTLVVIVVLSLFLLITDWQARDKSPLWQGKLLPMLVGLTPFLIVLAVYNFYAMGNALRSAYSPQYLSPIHFLKLGPWYLLSLLLIYPGMLAAPLLYRGAFWREGLSATALGVLIAGSYIEATYGANPFQTVVAITRQILPILPFFLLAYSGVLAAWRPNWNRLDTLSGKMIGLLLCLSAVSISLVHQRHLNQLQRIQTEITTTLPPNCIVYGNKDVFKLHFPIQDGRVYRELPFISPAEAAQDLQKSTVYVVLYTRSRGVSNEDGWNERVRDDVDQQFQTKAGPLSPTGLLQYYRVTGMRSP